MEFENFGSAPQHPYPIDRARGMARRTLADAALAGAVVALTAVPSHLRSTTLRSSPVYAGDAATAVRRFSHAPLAGRRLGRCHENSISREVNAAIAATIPQPHGCRRGTGFRAGCRLAIVRVSRRTVCELRFDFIRVRSSPHSPSNREPCAPLLCDSDFGPVARCSRI